MNHDFKFSFFWHFFHLNLLIKRACNCQITWWICTFRIHIWIIWTIWLCSNSFLKSEYYLYSYSFHFQKMNTICICMCFKITIYSNSDWSPKVQGFQGPGVPRSQGFKDQDISNSHSNTGLTLKKVHLVLHVKNELFHNE